MAVNELAVVHYLMGGQLPAQKWLAAVSPLTDRLPVVPLLGGHSDRRQRFACFVKWLVEQHYPWLK